MQRRSQPLCPFSHPELCLYPYIGFACKNAFDHYFNQFLFCFFSQVVISLQKMQASTRASLTSIKFFIREDPSSTLQTPHYTSPSTAWIVSEDETTINHYFNEVSIFLVQMAMNNHVTGSRVGAAVKALAFHRCGRVRFQT